jgi:uncharacterized membrane protein YgcG
MSLIASISADTVVVEPGTTAPLTIEIENTSENTDQVEIGIEGVDAEWVILPVSTVELKAGERQSVKVFFKPPRQSESTAGNFPFLARTRSLTTGDQKIAQGVLTIKAFHSLSLELNPKKGFVTATKHQNIFTATLMNMGNAEHTVQLAADDPEDSCTYEFDEEQVTLMPGHQRDVDFMVNPKKGSPFGAARLIGFVVTGRSTDTPGVVASSQAQLEVRPFITPATAIIAAIVMLLAMILWTTQPKPPTIRLEIIGTKRVYQGKSVTVRWVAENATDVKIVAGGDTVGEKEAPEGMKTIETPLLGTLRIQAVAFRDKRQSEAATVQVEVVEAPVIPDPKIIVIKPSSLRVKKGEKFTLEYKFNTAVVKAKLAPSNIELDLNVNTIVVEPFELGTNEFTVTAENSEKKVVKQTFKVEMYEPCLANIVKFDVQPTLVNEEDGKVLMSWQVTGAVRVEFSYTGGGKTFELDPSGSAEFPVSAKTNFTIKAFDVNGKSVAKSITVNYKKKAPINTDPTVIPNDPPTTSGDSGAGNAGANSGASAGGNAGGGGGATAGGTGTTTGR